MDTNIYIYTDPRVLRLRSKGREESSPITPVSSSVGQKIRQRDSVLNRALFADVSLRVPPSALFNFTRREEVSRTLFPRLSDIRPLRPLQTNLDDRQSSSASRTRL